MPGKPDFDRARGFHTPSHSLFPRWGQTFGRSLFCPDMTYLFSRKIIITKLPCCNIFERMWDKVVGLYNVVPSFLLQEL
jgi:hypothetical protein